MKITFISDTHYQHHQLPLDSGDMLIHCGDFTRRGDLGDVVDFADYLHQQAFTYKVVIAGNHDFCFEDERRKEAEQYLSDNGIIYLNDSGIEIEDHKIWGSPVQPEFFNWAFNRKRGQELQTHWDLIPDDTDILLTHGPAFGIADRCVDGVQVGCADLLKTIQDIQPKVHAFGHIHEGYGVVEKEGTTFVNACSVNERYRLMNKPITLEV